MSSTRLPAGIDCRHFSIHAFSRRSRQRLLYSDGYLSASDLRLNRSSASLCDALPVTGLVTVLIRFLADRRTNQVVSVHAYDASANPTTDVVGAYASEDR